MPLLLTNLHLNVSTNPVSAMTFMPISTVPIDAQNMLKSSSDKDDLPLFLQMCIFTNQQSF
ncbi:hypothetical protein CAEBREN_01302 [Caenorhabditis brenneri]|uniref:Uncharacterized protein n=1 Tax=Caenorhabditis brenneri TaxID=135651 RepID=G0MWD3_CAEBE|nr:hypothetical protein CAEBREN_01302 [Caenorhabditis brenneri]